MDGGKYTEDNELISKDGLPGEDSLAELGTRRF